MINDFIKKMRSKLDDLKLELYQITYLKSETNDINLFDNKVSSSSFDEWQNISLEVKLGKNIGSFSSEYLVEDNIDNIINQAIENAKIINCDDENFFHDGSGEYVPVKAYQPLMSELNKLNIVDFLQKLEQGAYAKDSRINKVISTRYRYVKGEIIKINSLGLNLDEKYESAIASIYLSAKNGEEVKTGSAVTAFEKTEDFDINKIIDEAVEDAVSRLNSIEVKSGKYSAIFKNTAFSDFLGMIASLCSAENIHEKRSKFAGMLNQNVASSVLTIIDNPLMDNGFASHSFDSEGYPTKNKKVIEKGKLLTYLHSLKTAHKDNCKPTGNGAGSGQVKTFNFYVEPGKSSKEDLLKKMDSGIYVVSLNGLHAGFNMVTGDLSFGADGYLVKDGKIDKPINQFTVATNLYDMLFNIREVGSDLLFEVSKYGSPCVLVDNISIASK